MVSGRSRYKYGGCAGKISKAGYATGVLDQHILHTGLRIWLVDGSLLDDKEDKDRDMEEMITISRSEYDDLTEIAVRSRDFVSIILKSMEKRGITTFDGTTVLVALKALYPNEYEAEVYQRTADKEDTSEA